MVVAVGAAVIAAVIVCVGVYVWRAEQPAAPSASVGDSGPVRVLVAGDSMPFTLAAAVAATGSDRVTGMHVAAATKMGCGVGRADSIIGGEHVPQHPGCRTWPQEWPARVQTVDPEATVLLAWAWELYDRRVMHADGSFEDLYVGTPEWFEWFEGEVQAVVDIFTATGAPLVVLTLPCVDLEADTARHPPAETAEPHRVASVNEALERVVDRNADRGVHLLDTNAYLCPDGRYRAVIDDVRLTDDGQHLSTEGGSKLWNDWLSVELRVLLGLEAPSTVERP